MMDREAARQLSKRDVRIAELEAELSAANDLLAVIHRDGGHHTGEVGFKQSCEDAVQVVCALRTELAESKQNLQAIRSEHASQLAFLNKIVQELKESHEQCVEKAEALDWLEKTLDNDPEHLLCLGNIPIAGKYVKFHNKPDEWFDSLLEAIQSLKQKQ